MHSHSTNRTRHLRLDSLENRVLPTVTTSFDAVTGLLTVRGEANDAIAVSAVGPLGAKLVAVNGKATQVATSVVETVNVRGGAGNNRINLPGVKPTAFVALNEVHVDGGAGNDKITGSPFDDDLAGGPGRDVIKGMTGNDTIRGGGDVDVLDGGIGDDVVKSSDPVEAGFNDTFGLNADALPNSPYQIGGILFGHGQGEAGWSSGWQQRHGDPSAEVVQSDIVFEGDGALWIKGPSTTGVHRSFTDGVSTGVVTVSQMMYIPAGGGIAQYLTDASDTNADSTTAAQWGAGAGGNIQIVDAGIWENTGIPVPVQEWFRVDVQLDMTAKTFEFYFNGVKYQSPDPLNFRGNPGVFNNIDYFVEGTTGGYIDALQVDGPDTLTPTATGDILRGGHGDDTLRGASSPDLMLGGPDNDSLSGGGGNDIIKGNSGNDELVGEHGDDQIDGSAGDDTQNGGVGADKLFGGPDHDQMVGGEDGDYLDGGAGDDSLDGGLANDFVTGGAGDDTVLGNTGADRLFGSSGNDSVKGGGGADWLDGGTGDDLVESGDPPLPAPVSAGFNDAEGINSDPTDNSPYTLGGTLLGSGVGEPGWAGGWNQPVGSTNNAMVQSTTKFDGDGAMQITGGTTGVNRAILNAEASGVVTVTQMINVPAGGGAMQYLYDGSMPDTPTRVAVNWDAHAALTNFRVLDVDTWENTGIPIPIQDWVKVTIRMDMTARTFDFFINDNQYIPPDPLGFRGNPGAMSHVGYLVENLPGIYIDAIQVFGPDPAGDPFTFGDTLTGGAGNDIVRGDRGNDLIQGSAGDDELDGGAGRDVMIGGLGTDNLDGGDGEDILIGGATRHDRHLTALPGILAEWTSSRALPVRQANIAGTGSGSRLNGSYFLNPSRVKADGSPDSLTGGADIDWFFYRFGEDDTDADASDLLTSL
jgi:Ca2+-binding RTX toxin-like protein